MYDSGLMRWEGEPAYSYLRYSRPSQAAGDTVRRQMEGSAAYAAKHGLRLIKDYKDLAVSAKDGLNRTIGALGAFLKDVKDLNIPRNCHLLVENLDRLSRQKARTAQRHFLDMIDEGVTIHTLMDGQVYSAQRLDDNSILLIGSILIMIRANEENVARGRRVKGAKDRNRQAAIDDGTLMTAMCPAWLIAVGEGKTRSFRGIPQRIAVIRRIYDMSIDGMGAESICRRLNLDGVPAFGDIEMGKIENGWHKHYVNKLLTWRAVCGDFIPQDPANPIIPGYYVDEETGQPAIDEVTWAKSRFARESRRNKVAIQATVSSPANPTGHVINNLFNGLTRCGECGGTLSTRQKGVPAQSGRLRQKRLYYICDNYKRGRGCRNKRNLEYLPIETGILDHIWQMSSEDTPTDTATEKIRIIENEMAKLAQRAKHLQERITAFMSGDEAPTAALREGLQRMAVEKDRALRSHAELAQRLSGLRTATPRIEHLDVIRLLRQQAQEGDIEARARINQGLREIVDCIVYRAPNTMLLVMAGRRVGMQFDGGKLVCHADGAWVQYPREWAEWLAKVPPKDYEDEQRTLVEYYRRLATLPSADAERMLPKVPGGAQAQGRATRYIGGKTLAPYQLWKPPAK